MTLKYNMISWPKGSPQLHRTLVVPSSYLWPTSIMSCKDLKSSQVQRRLPTILGRSLMNGWQMHVVAHMYCRPKHMRDRNRGQHTQEFPRIDQAPHDLRCCLMSGWRTHESAHVYLRPKHMRDRNYGRHRCRAHSE